jgi:CheY-like chemotaxis protein
LKAMALHLLLFSPDAKAALVLGHVLSELDVEVEFSSEIFNAVEKVTRDSFDAIIVDCTNEIEAAFLLKTARELKSNRESLTLAIMPPAVPINNGLQAGAHGILRKPIIAAEARDVLRTVCDLIRSRQAGRPANPAVLPSNVVPLRRETYARPAQRRAEDPQVEVQPLAAEPVANHKVVTLSPADPQPQAEVPVAPDPLPSLMQPSSLDEADKIRAIFHSMSLRDLPRKREWKIGKPLLWASSLIVSAALVYMFVPLAAYDERVVALAASLLENRENAGQMVARYSPTAPVIIQAKKAEPRHIEIDDSRVPQGIDDPENIKVTPIYPVPQA